MGCEPTTDQNPLFMPLEVIEVEARSVVHVNDDSTEAVITNARTQVIVSGKRGPQGPKGDVGDRSKAGWITYSSFLGSPRTAPVVFDIPFLTTDYSIVISGIDVRQWSVEEQTPAGFVINSNADAPIKHSVFWNATSKWG